MAGGMGRPVSLRHKTLGADNAYGSTIRMKRQVQNTNEYRQQKNFALMRAKNRCEKCGAAKGEKGPDGKIVKQLDMHHLEELDTLLAKYNITNIQQARMCPKLWDTKNAQILCPYCHAETDSYGKVSELRKKDE
jgi:hypothetical protein